MLSTEHEAVVQKLVDGAKADGVVSYQQLNDNLPPEVVQVEDIDAVLSRFEESGIEILETVEYRRRREAAKRHKALTAMSKQSDARDLNDPVRMYLSQMGTIPLLSRDEEIRLAKTIELMSNGFRGKILESDIAIDQAQRVGRCSDMCTPVGKLADGG